LNDSIYKSISFTLISNLWLTFATLICTPLYIKFLGIESYGLIGFYITLLSIIGVVDNGLSSAALREIARMNSDNAQRSQIKDLFFSLELIYWPIIAAFTLILSYLVNTDGNQWIEAETINATVLSETTSLILLLIIFQVPIGLYMNGLLGFKKNINFAQINTIFGTIRTFGVLPFLYYFEDIRVFFMWQIFWAIIQILIARLILFLQLKKISVLKSKFSMHLITKIKSFVGGMFLVTILSIIVSQIDKIILSKMLTLESFAYYMLAFTVALSLSRITTPIIQIYWAEFSSLTKDNKINELKEKFFQCFELLCFAILPFTVVIFLFSEPLLLLWTNDQNLTSNTSTLLTILILATAFSSLSLPALTVLYAKNGYLRYVNKVNVIGLIFIGSSIFILTPIYGSLAAANLILIYGVFIFFMFNFKVASILELKNPINLILQKLLPPIFISLAISGLLYVIVFSLTNRLLIFLTFSFIIICNFFVILILNKSYREILLNSKYISKYRT